MVRDQMQEVLLVEVTGLDQRDTAPRHSGAVGAAAAQDIRLPGRERARALRHRWLIAAGLVALLVVAGVVAAARARDRAALLADLPGVLAPIGPSLSELWRAPMLGWGQAAAVGGDVLLYESDGPAAAEVVLLDGRTGERRWTAPMPEATEAGEVWCSPLGDVGREPQVEVACRVEGAPGSDVQDGVARSDGLARLVVLDASTGERLAERPMNGLNVSFAPFGHDLIVTDVLPDGHAQVSRLDPLSGAVAWTFRSAHVPRGPAEGPTWLFPSVQHGVIVANGPVSWAFASDGTVLGEWHLEGGDWAVRGGWGLDIAVLPDGRFAVGESGGVGLSDEQYGTVSATDARDGFPIPGPVLVPVVDDGSVADVLLTVPSDRGGIVAISAVTGTRRWDSGAMAWGDALVLDGRLIVMAGRRLTALDARGGHELWTADIPMGNHSQQVLTDGRVILVPMFDPERGAVLVAFDPADGRERWSAALPEGVNYLVAVEGRLLAVTNRDLVALG